jgi:alkylation response protein AidB-like acyl-CoA dehydrogenase
MISITSLPPSRAISALPIWRQARQGDRIEPGAAGYSRDLPLEKHYRDAKAMTVLEGASEIQRHIIAGEL